MTNWGKKKQNKLLYKAKKIRWFTENKQGPTILTKEAQKRKIRLFN